MISEILLAVQLYCESRNLFSWFVFHHFRMNLNIEELGNSQGGDIKTWKINQIDRSSFMNEYEIKEANITRQFIQQSRKNRGCLSLIFNMENQFSAVSAVLKKLPKKKSNYELWATFELGFFMFSWSKN